MTYRMRGFRMAKVILLLGSLSLAVAIACGSDDDPAPVATSAPASTAEPAATAQPAATAEAAATATAAPVTAPTEVMAPSDGDGPSGDVVMAIRRVNSVYGVAYTGPYRGSAHQQTGGIDEFLFVMGSDGNAMTPQLADDWQVDAAGTKVTITMKSAHGMGRTMRRWIFFQTNRPAREMIGVQMALIAFRRRQRLSIER